MKELVRQLVERAPNPLTGNAIVREYLQARVLEFIQESGAFLRWAFLGGTALRFLYSIPRFSEDLDFSVINPDSETGFRQTMSAVKRLFVREGYTIEILVNEHNPVASAWIKFPGLPYATGLSPHPSQVLSIKLELDTKPPKGAQLETSIIRRHCTVNLCHYDKASLFAGKIHAILCRQWTKGRDLFDLAWYLADRQWPEPNLVQLNAALAQTGWPGPVLTGQSWRDTLIQKLELLDWESAKADVFPFLETSRDIELVSFPVLLKLLKPS